MHADDDDFYRNSDFAGRYAACRPSPPRDFLQYLSRLAPSQTCAWDCGTGNGQVAIPLAEFFSSVVATDQSNEQIGRARKVPNVRYHVADAGRSGIPSGSVDLVTVGQAVHWFPLEGFYLEVSRVLKPGGLVALWCYRRPRVDSRIDRLVYCLWQCLPRPAAIQFVEDEYANLSFPFDEIAFPPFSMTERWNSVRFIDYLNTWSWLSKVPESSPEKRTVSELLQRLSSSWGTNTRDVTWDLFIRLGKRA
jgi:SAM-dependent methyltransferase